MGVFRNRALLTRSVVPEFSGRNMFVARYGDQRTFVEHHSPRRIERRSPCGFRGQISGQILARLPSLSRDSDNRVQLLRNCNRRRLVDASLDISGFPFKTRGRRLVTESFRTRFLHRHPFRKGLTTPGAGFNPPPPRVPMASAASLAGVFVLLPLRLGFLFEERLTVSDRDLVVVWINFGESEKARAIPAIVDESGLKRWLYAGDLSEIDITS